MALLAVVVELGTMHTHDHLDAMVQDAALDQAAKPEREGGPSFNAATDTSEGNMHACQWGVISTSTAVQLTLP